MENSNVKVIDLTTETKPIVQEVGEIFTQIVNELVGLRGDLKPMGVNIIKKYTDEIDNLYNTISDINDDLDEYKNSSDKYYNLFMSEKEKNNALESKYEQLLYRLNI